MVTYSTQYLQYLLEIGQLANAGYSPDSGVGRAYPGGYTQIAQSHNTANGFGGGAFYNTDSNSMVISFTGTQPTQDAGADLLADLSMALYGGVTPQDQSARDFAQATIAAQRMSAINSSVNAYTYDAPNITYTGHSLGGELAQVVSTIMGNAIAIVYNSPGMGGLPLDTIPPTGNQLIGPAIDFISALGADLLYDRTTVGNPNITYVYSEDWGLATPIHALGATTVGSEIVTIPNTSGHNFDRLLQGIDELINGVSAAVEISDAYSAALAAASLPTGYAPNHVSVDTREGPNPSVTVIDPPVAETNTVTGKTKHGDGQDQTGYNDNRNLQQRVCCCHRS
jgi:hypothetical protein